jgi:hypothetical protein
VLEKYPSGSLLCLPDSKLSLFADAKLTTKQCNTVRLQTEDLMVNIYLPYYVIKEAKNACYQVANPADGVPTLT